jgi:hypothetical protein
MRYHLPCRCGKPWSAEAFYKGQPCYCKECWKAVMRRRRADPVIAAGERDSASVRRANNPSYLADQRERYTNPHNRARAIRNVDKWRQKYPERAPAIDAVKKAINTTYALDRGPCEKCNTTVRVCGFHIGNYADPLRVTWRCRACHGAAQREARLAWATAQAISIDN